MVPCACLAQFSLNNVHKRGLKHHSFNFISPQDTVVALQALAKFANIIKSESGNVDVSVMVDDETHDFMVTGDNHLLLQKKQLTTVPDAGHMTDIRFSANGSGCALVQVS